MTDNAGDATPNARRKRLRAVLAGGTCVFPASVHDPISARIAQEIGFETGILAGSVVALSVLGAPDIILLTLDEFAETARRIGRASALPVIADADHGYGNALNAMRTVEELEAAGIAGLTIEDTLLPRPFGPARAQVLGLDEALGKVAAAVEARSDPALCVFARTSAISAEGLEAACERVRAFQDLGVDGVFVTGASTRADVEALGRAARVPLLLGAVAPDLLDPVFLASCGVRVTIRGHQPFAAAVHAIEATMRALRAGEDPPPLADAQTMDRLSAGPQWRARTQLFLGG